jgi:hypothetical protein
VLLAASAVRARSAIARRSARWSTCHRWSPGGGASGHTTGIDEPSLWVIGSIEPPDWPPDTQTAEELLLVKPELA